MSERSPIGVCEGQMLSPIVMPKDYRWTCASLSTPHPLPLFHSQRVDVLRFFMFVVHNKRGDVGLEAATFGEAQYIAICLGMHREDVSPSTYMR